jgi:hypothetical protein
VIGSQCVTGLSLTVIIILEFLQRSSKLTTIHQNAPFCSN